MGVTSEAVWARASEARLQAGELRSDCRTERQRADQITDRLAQTLCRCGTRALGDRGDSFRLELASLRPLVRLARTDPGRWLEQTGLPSEIISEVTLACSEACANAVEHPQQASRQRIALAAERHGSPLEVRVRDYGSWREHPQSQERGRGLSMINDLMDSVDLRHSPAGSELVMRRSLPGS